MSRLANATIALLARYTDADDLCGVGRLDRMLTTCTPTRLMRSVADATKMQRYSQPDDEVYRAHNTIYKSFAMPTDLAVRAFRSVACLAELGTWHPPKFTLPGPFCVMPPL